MTQVNLWHFEKILCKLYLFNQMQALYNLSWCVAHSILATFLGKVPHTASESELIFIWQDFAYFLNNASEEDEINISFSIDTESLTICFIVHWQENIKMKILNFFLGTNFIFYIAATSRSRCSLLFYIKVVLGLALVHSKYIGNF